MPFPSALLLLGAALVSGYAFAEHTRATLRLKLKYEEKGRKVAKWSSSVERLMWDTRTTLAFGLVAAAISFLSALNLLLFNILLSPLRRRLGPLPRHLGRPSGRGAALRLVPHALLLARQAKGAHDGRVERRRRREQGRDRAARHPTLHLGAGCLAQAGRPVTEKRNFTDLASQAYG